MDDNETVEKSDVVYSSGEEGPTSVLSERVSSLAAAIYAEFERMIQKHGQDVVAGLMPMMVSVLEQLDAAYNDNNEQYVDLELLNDDNEQLLTQYEREKQLRKIAENKYLQVEDEHDQEKQEILTNLEEEKHEKRTLESKIKSLADHVQRTEERLNEKTRDYGSLHQRHSEMVHHFMERLEKGDKASRFLLATPGGALETPKKSKSGMLQENGGLPGLYMSVSQPNLAPVTSPVSPTPKTPNENTADVNLEDSLAKNNDLSFEDESVVKLQGDDEKMVGKSFVEAESTRREGGVVSLSDEAEAVKHPTESVPLIKGNNGVLSNKPIEVAAELNASSISSSFSAASSDPDSSNVKTCSITDINHVPIVTVKDVHNLIVSPKSKSETGSESIISDLSPDVRAILSSTPELESSVTSMSARNSRLNKSTKGDVRTSLNFEAAQEFVNTNSLFAELSSQEPSVIGEIDEGAEISVMGKELESVLKENEELMKTKSKLLTQKNDLLNRVEEISSENEVLKEERKDIQTKMDLLSTKRESHEQQQEIKRLKHELDKSTMALKEANVSAAHRKRFSRVEMARVLMERNQYKERLMELQEAVRWTEMIRASKEKSNELQQKKKSWVWKFFSGLFNTAPKKPNSSPVSIKYTPSAQGAGSARTDSDNNVDASPGVVDSQVDRQRLMEKRTRLKQLRTQISSGLSEGRMQAYGWSLPARYSTEGANGSKGLVSVPVPIYCRPLNISEPGMKIWCATVVERRTKDGGSAIGGSVFYAESCRESSEASKESNSSSLEESPSSTLWIGSSTHSCSKITIIDGNSPQKILECFVLCSSHLLCIATVPGVSEDDFEDVPREKEVSPESFAEDTRSSPVQERDADTSETSSGVNGFNKADDSGLSTSGSEIIDPLDVKPKAVHGDQGMSNDTNQHTDLNGKKSVEGTMDKVTTMFPTVWFGAQSGSIYIHSAVCEWKRCLHSVKLRDSVLSIVHVKGKVLIALADGTVAIFNRKPDGQWDVRNYHLLDLGRPHHSIRCMTVVHDNVWCGYRNKIQVINPQIMRIVKSFDAHPRRESQVRQLSCIGDGVWVSIRLDSTLRLYNAHTYHHLQDVDIEPCVSSLIGAGKLGFSFVRITALMLTKDRMWVGTGNGVILSVPLVAAQPANESARSVVATTPDSSNSPSGGPGGVVRVYTDTTEKGEKSVASSFMPYCSMINAQISFHGHRDSVKFFIAVPGTVDKTSTVCSPKVSTQPSMQTDPSMSTSSTMQEERSWLVISGGEGYVDFRSGDNIEGGENIGGPEDIPSSSKMSSTENSHVMVWQVTGN